MLGGIIASLIANGLTTLVSYGVRKSRELAKLRDAIRGALGDDTELVLAIQEVTKVVHNSIKSSDGLQDTMIKVFLESPTTESIVRQIFSDFMLEGTQPKSVEQLQEEFELCLASHLRVANVNDTHQLAVDLFAVIHTGCRRALDFAISQDILSAHEAKGIERHKILFDELQAIKSNVEFLMANSHLDLEAVREFEGRYRRQVGKRSDHITIPHFDRAPSIPIDRIFVSPSFIWTPEDKDVIPAELPLSSFLTRLYRSVLLGDPGGGKTTLAQKICYELSENYEKRVVGGRLLTPVLVVLREYSAKKKLNNNSIVQFMESEVTSKYQFPSEAPSGTFEYLLLNGHVLVIFDGLDELLDPSHRREISKDIESFCNLFPAVPVFVTSRVVGYEQAPLDSERFDTFHIAPFDDDQVSEYVGKWFENDPDHEPDESEQSAQAFLEESRIVSDLRSNPLMLALMCNLYKGPGFIPQNRPQLYEKCSEMLFERWDPSRGIIWAHLPVSEPKALLSHLAHWFYCDESLQSGAKENQIIRESAKFLYPRRFETEEEAEKASQEFIGFCRGRAWVFTDVGTTPGGINLYKFTHKTFLEYFTAKHIVRNNNIPVKLWQLLGPRIAERTWDMVAQLAFQMLHEQVEGASDELLELLIQEAGEDKSACWPYLSFGARCLHFIYPSPKTIRALTEASVEWIVRGDHSSSTLPHGAARDLIHTLITVTAEFHSAIADILQTEIVGYSEDADDGIALRAIELGLTLRSNDHELYKYWREVARSIFNQVSPRLEALALNDLLAWILHASYYISQKMIESLFADYTPDHLFSSPNSSIHKSTTYISIAETMIIESFRLRSIEHERLENINAALAEVGKILLDRPLPYFSHEVTRTGPGFLIFYLRSPQSVESIENSISMPGEAVVGAWCLCAAFAEGVEGDQEFISRMSESEDPAIKAISDVLEARRHGLFSGMALRGFMEFDPPEVALEFVKQWINGQISFVHPPKPAEEKDTD